MSRRPIADADLTTLQLAVPAVDPLLDRLRSRLPGATVLSPGHISFGYPWLPPAAAAAHVEDVASALSGIAPATVSLTGPRHFPPDAGGRVTLHLVPDPAAAVHVIAEAITAAAGHRPDRFAPHCSLVRVPAGSRDLAAADRLVAARGTVRAHLTTVELRVRHGRRWSVARTMRLGGH